ncbi:MAG: hypothetical protein UX13_C0001G0006 [Candidatus Woesebacteria bacterium GW2011_GWB1_45_5]|uniref:Uncharacterized protein n=1 Tax=Candidatus Woesebacteria bacterium GW2011_GWB1_45_5 TaxID=1618581 RepID=A0A0G1QQJ6_9BACT|nr:MAG: hypothetical protein UX13_C0001G0006 [Candidatus Woesebacteria bacterium GW2011_GWB1_45_5]
MWVLRRRESVPACGGKSWAVEKDGIPVEQVTNQQAIPSTTPFFVAGKKARFIKVKSQDLNSCILTSDVFYVWYLE